jgi:hypothetical protein
MLLTVLRILAVPTGCLTYYIAFFMYENEEGKWQNRMENLWVTIHDREEITGSKLLAFFNKISVVVTQGFDWIFGPRLFSLRAVGVSTSYSLAGLFLSGFFAFTILLWMNNPLDAPLPEELVKHWRLVEAVCLLTIAFFSLLALLPSLSPSRWFGRLSLFPAFFFGIGLLLALIERRHTWRIATVSAALLVSFLADIFLVALVRFTVRWILAKTSVSRIALAVLIQLGVIILITLAPFTIGTGLIETFGPRPAFIGVMMVALLNTFAGLISFLFVLVLFFALLHKIIWPVLGRLFYPLARYQLVRNSKIMAGIGTACFIFAFPVLPDTVKSILAWAAK